MFQSAHLFGTSQNKPVHAHRHSPRRGKLLKNGAQEFMLK